MKVAAAPAMGGTGGSIKRERRALVGQSLIIWLLFPRLSSGNRKRQAGGGTSRLMPLRPADCLACAQVVPFDDRISGNNSEIAKQFVPRPSELLLLGKNKSLLSISKFIVFIQELVSSFRQRTRPTFIKHVIDSLKNVF